MEINKLIKNKLLKCSVFLEKKNKFDIIVSSIKNLGV
jgi:hypothetical protein